MTFQLTDEALTMLKMHAAKECPRECCGLIVNQIYRPVHNVATTNEHFVMDERDWAKAEDSGAIEAICHSHPYAQPTPSMADRVACERSGLPWVIVGHPNEVVAYLEPCNYSAPLIGREFCHGVLDCYTLVQDYYRTLDIILPDFEREDLWWMKNQNLYLDNFKAAGFFEVDPITVRPNDGLLMQIRSPVPNHSAVMLEGNIILQHLMNRLSSRNVYGSSYLRWTTHILRHKQLA